MQNAERRTTPHQSPLATASPQGEALSVGFSIERIC